jgi:hypothetical protein
METWKVYKCVIFVAFVHTSKLQQNPFSQFLEVFDLEW